jgi:predicted N-acetyltransferase YhbS
MQIQELSLHPELIQIITTTLHKSWGNLGPWSDPETIRARLIAGASGVDSPRTFVVVTESGSFVATGSVKLFEVPTEPQLVYWIGEIFVLPAHRGKGLGSNMMRSLSEYAFSKGAPQLFLYTPDQQLLYARLGWQHVMQKVFNGEDVSIMTLHREI